MGVLKRKLSKRVSRKKKPTLKDELGHTSDEEVKKTQR